MRHLNIGDKVFLKTSLIKWYLSKDGQNTFHPYSGILDAYQEETLNQHNTVMLTLAMKNDIAGEVKRINWPGTSVMNYRVEILGLSINVEPKYLERV
jgi:hypothetical protein